MGRLTLDEVSQASPPDESEDASDPVRRLPLEHGATAAAEVHAVDAARVDVSARRRRGVRRQEWLTQAETGTAAR